MSEPLVPPPTPTQRLLAEAHGYTHELADRLRDDAILAGILRRLLTEWPGMLRGDVLGLDGSAVARLSDEEAAAIRRVLNQ